MLCLNFDMVGSPNFVRFVYDGDGSAFGRSGRPEWRGSIESVFLDSLQSLESEPTAFDGPLGLRRFHQRGRSGRGLFTGAEEIKTAAQANIYGGTAGIAYDPCYHQACDTIGNVARRHWTRCRTRSRMPTLLYAMTTSSVNGTDAPRTAAKENMRSCTRRRSKESQEWWDACVPHPFPRHVRSGDMGFRGARALAVSYTHPALADTRRRTHGSCPSHRDQLDIDDELRGCDQDRPRPRERERLRNVKAWIRSSRFASTEAPSPSTR